MDVMAGAVGAILVVYVVIMIFTIGLSVALYVFSSLGLYSHAKRHNLDKPWLAWLPVGNYWISGVLADMASANKPNKKLCYSKWLLGLSLGVYGGLFLIIIMMTVMFVGVFGLAADMGSEAEAIPALMIGMIVYILVYFALYAASIATLVIWSIGMYHVYRMYCTKGVALTFAILGGVFGLHGIFLFAIRKKPILVEEPQPIYTTYTAYTAYTNAPPQGYYDPQQPPQGYAPPQNAQVPPQGYHPPQDPQA